MQIRIGNVYVDSQTDRHFMVIYKARGVVKLTFINCEDKADRWSWTLTRDTFVSRMYPVSKLHNIYYKSKFNAADLLEEAADWF